jgi:transcriptional regulator with XRE-family HTH domain
MMEFVGRSNGSMAIWGMEVRMFGDVVRAHRRQLSWTQEELAEKAGISARSIGKIEAGRIATPRPYTVRLLADAFGLTGADRDRFGHRIGEGDRPAVRDRALPIATRRGWIHWPRVAADALGHTADEGDRAAICGSGDLGVVRHRRGGQADAVRSVPLVFIAGMTGACPHRSQMIEVGARVTPDPLSRLAGRADAVHR